MGVTVETLQSILADADVLVARLDQLELSLQQRDMVRTLRAYIRIAKTHFREAHRLLVEAEEDCAEVTKVWVRE